MDEPKNETPDSADKKKDQASYEAPRIVWREPYEPVAFGVSCARQPGNPGCQPGPFSA